MMDDGKIGDFSNNREDFFKSVISIKSLLNHTNGFFEFKFENCENLGKTTTMFKDLLR
jgi:hypothetical protein